MFKDNALFVQEFFRSFHSTGSVCPTSRWASKAMVAPLAEKQKDGPLQILELGPGTGSVTRHILRAMGFGDSLTVCEINERFMEALKTNLSDDTYYDTHRSRVVFHCCPMQQLPETQKYDVIVCAIPFLNFDLALVKELFKKISSLSHKDTIMTYYEYKGLRRLGTVFSGPATRKRMKTIDEFIINIHESHVQSKNNVWLNIMPIKVYQLDKLDQMNKICGAT